MEISMETLIGAAFILCALLAAIYSTTNASKVIVFCTFLLILGSILIYEEVKREYPNNNIEVVPTCAEDEIITGSGDFGPDGYWGEYKCEQTDTLFCSTLYHFLELREPYLNEPPLTNEQIRLVDEMNGWYTCPQS
ncbi:hypothetical protein LCGC14_2345380 [marine sediment metagenome]|uniref:Uncharacterized protein n=1 Tax=marine sediment metagenome TaxID=412755 RepID=A0A0F9CBK3_9ZZZZ